MTHLRLTVSILCALLLFQKTSFAEIETIDATVEVKVFTTAYPNYTHCSNIAFLVFPAFEKVTYLTASYYDLLKDSSAPQIDPLTPPFEDDFSYGSAPDGFYDAGSGMHQISLAGSFTADDAASPDNCANAKQALLDRFIAPKVTVDRFGEEEEEEERDNTISGTVMEWNCSSAGVFASQSSPVQTVTFTPGTDTASICEQRGAANVPMRAIPVGRGRIGSTRTNADGFYQMDVQNGTYRVRPRSSRADFTPRRRRVTVNDNRVTGVDFEAVSERRVRLRARRRRLHPGGVFLRSGGLVRICNSDAFDHHYNIRALQRNDLGRQRSGECRRRRLPTNTGAAPILLEVFCDLHPRELGLIWVTPE